MCRGWSVVFLTQKRAGEGRGVNEKQHGLANVRGSFHVGSDSGNEHGNAGLESSSNILKNSAVNASLESFPPVSEAHRNHPPASANEEKMNDDGTKVGPTPA
ncbi:hypothetical protein Tco_0258221, partial [Tanacetum coccineum]